MTLVNNQLETLDYVTATAVSSPAAETAIVSTDVVNASTYWGSAQAGNPQVIRPVVIEVTVNVTPGTSATALVFRVRQGVGTGGALVTSPGGAQAITVGVTAAVNNQFQFKWRDTSGAPFGAAGTAYTVTVAETSATVAGTVNAIDVEVKQ